MKSSHIIFLSIYVICIICGFGIGKALTQTEAVETKQPSEFPTPQSIPTLKNGQQNLLVITVDKLELQQPKLESVWLVTHIINNPSITFLPISPTLSNGKVVIDDALFGSFETTREDGNVRVSPSFFDALTLRNFWWSGYLVVDQQAFLNVLDEASKMPINSTATNSDQNDDDLTAVTRDPETMYRRHAHLLKDACQLFAQQSGDFNWRAFSALNPRHIQTDLDVNLIIGEWVSSLKSIETPLCNFPLDTFTSDTITQ